MALYGGMLVLAMILSSFNHKTGGTFMFPHTKLGAGFDSASFAKGGNAR